VLFAPAATAVTRRSPSLLNRHGVVHSPRAQGELLTAADIVSGMLRMVEDPTVVGAVMRVTPQVGL